MANDSKKIVYVIDDEKDLLELYTSILSPHFEVVGFMNPKDALAEIKKNKAPAALISDIMMPGMTGIQLVEELRKLKVQKPVIVISAYADKDNAIKALDLGVFAMVEKPFNNRQLLSTVKRAIMSGMQDDLSRELIERYKAIADNVRDFLQFFRDGYELAEKQLRAEASEADLKDQVDACLDFNRKASETQILLNKLEADINFTQTQYESLRNLMNQMNP